MCMCVYPIYTHIYLIYVCVYEIDKYIQIDDIDTDVDIDIDK